VSGRGRGVPYDELVHRSEVARRRDPLCVPAHLQTLQDHVKPVPFEEIRPVVEAELGGTLEELFVWFDPEPLASASIGQVHRARLEGEREVVLIKAKAEAEATLVNAKAQQGAIRLVAVGEGLVSAAVP